jgi:hypothetical protein
VLSPPTTAALANQQLPPKIKQLFNPGNELGNPNYPHPFHRTMQRNNDTPPVLHSIATFRVSGCGVYNLAFA